MKACAHLLVVLGLLLVSHGCYHSAGEEANETAVPVPVRVAKVARQTFVPTLDLVGQVIAIPEQVVDICAKTTGWVDTVAVTEGSQVRMGDVLVKLDPRLAEIELARTKAVQQKAEAYLARLERGYLPQEVTMAEQQLIKAQEELRLAEKKRDALRPLLERHEIPPLQMEEAEAACRQAEAAVAEARAKLELYRAGTPSEELAEAQADVLVAQAQSALAALERDLCTVSSPCNGVVTALRIHRGMVVDKTTLLLTLIDLSKVFVQVRVPAEHAEKISLGAAAKIRDLMGESRTRVGEVARISPTSDPSTGDLLVYVAVDNTEEPVLRPGMSCRVSLDLKKRDNVLVIPTAALADHSGTTVVTVIRDGKAFEIPVTVGARAKDIVEIVSGVSEGELVAEQGGYSLPDGYPVKIVTESANK
uniref:Efflux transporter, RND family, MFP subunit n=1 Tax=uncultured Planctomycetota bacterium TaxID=120965 RepID=H5SAT7_9BACT|nr:efflux transporter, RND family, MFP subunit [uncultured Planctomycetota bacterium]